MAAVDLSLLERFRFACRPGCGLCCYGTPAVSSTEKARLLTIAPELAFLPADEGFSLLAARPNGGACTLLSDNRCRAHTDRPFPCRAYPLVVHVGSRAQATPVLACPGVVSEDWPSDPGPGLPRDRFPSEVAAVHREAASVPMAEWCAEGARTEARLWRVRTPEESAERVATMRRALAREPLPRDGEPLPPPDGSSPLEELPIFFDAGNGRVVARTDPLGRYELWAVDERGAPPSRLASYVPPTGPVALSEDGERVLAAYGRILLARDHFLWASYHEVVSGSADSIEARVRSNLADALLEVQRRAVVRTALAGEAAATLDASAVVLGIRALDAELLDRPTAGRIL